MIKKNQPNREKSFYSCAHCGTALFARESFLKTDGSCLCFSMPKEDKAVETASYRKKGKPKIGISCRSCGKHIGDLYDDSSSPSSRRYCMSGVARMGKVREKNLL